MLLFQALARHAPTLTAFQRLGVNVAPSIEHYDPEPDVAVIDAITSQNPEIRYVDRFYLAAEVVSASDRAWAEKKREIYKLHGACNCILTVQQDRVEVRIDLRTDACWREETLTKPDDVLALPEFGLRCLLSELYRGTALLPRKSLK